jgi:predicted alpha/beta-hydrolase family hydrolase
MVEVATPFGPAALVMDAPQTVVSLLVLGHGAGGSVEAVDLVTLRDVAVRNGVAVARVTQPYRVAGRRLPAPARQLDAAFTLTVRAAQEHLGDAAAGLPLIVGGRSSGARVACRTAASLGAVGVVALAFPLHPPGREDRSRAGELPTDVPTFVVNGDRDPFGVPTGGGVVEVCVRPGEGHDFKRDPIGAADAVVTWLTRQGWAKPS